MPNQEQIAKAILKGFKDAEYKYRDWSDGNILGSSAEHVVYVFIADAIRKVPGNKIFLEIEKSCKEVVEKSCGNKWGKIAKATRENGHIDIVLSWANNKPRAIIEVKNNVYNYKGQCVPDIERIKTLLKRPKTSLKFGVFAFYSWAEDGVRKTAVKKLDDKFKFIKEQISNDYADSLRISSETKIYPYTNIENKACAWSASYILMKLE